MFSPKKQVNTPRTAVINIADIVAPIVSSRDIAANLEKNIANSLAERVVLDFSKVKFISRSAAHQLLMIKEQFQHAQPKKEVVFENTNEDVKEMFRIIAANRAVPESKKPTFNAEKISMSALIKMSTD